MDGAIIMATLCCVILFSLSCFTSFLMNEIIANSVSLFSTGNNKTSKFKTFSHSVSPVNRKIRLIIWQYDCTYYNWLKIDYCEIDRINWSVRWLKLALGVHEAVSWKLPSNRVWHIVPTFGRFFAVPSRNPFRLLDTSFQF